MRAILSIFLFFGAASYGSLSPHGLPTGVGFKYGKKTGSNLRPGGPDPIPAGVLPASFDKFTRPGSLLDKFMFIPGPDGKLTLTLKPQKDMRPANYDELQNEMDAGANILIFGENHANPLTREFLSKHMSWFVSNNFSHFAVELPSDFNSHVSETDSGRQQIDFDQLRKDLEETGDPDGTLEEMLTLIKAANKSGIRISFIDISIEEAKKIMPKMTADEFYKYREKAMAKKLAEIELGEGERAFSLVGGIHAHKSRLPKLLAKNFSRKSIAIRMTQNGNKLILARKVNEKDGSMNTDYYDFYLELNPTAKRLRPASN